MPFKGSVLAVLIIAVQCCTGQLVYFEKQFGTGMDDAAKSIVQIPSGSLYVTGYSGGGPFGNYDVHLTKLDEYGNVIWTKYYGDANTNYGSQIIFTSDKHLLIVGENYSIANNTDGYVMKLDTNGTVIWTYVLSTSESENARSVCEMDDGNYLVTGFETSSNFDLDNYAMKISASGMFLWKKSFGYANTETPNLIKKVEGGYYLITGDTDSRKYGSIDVDVYKIDSLGSLLWDSAYGFSEADGSQGFLMTQSGNYLVYGEARVTQNAPFDFLIYKIDKNGNCLTKKNFGGKKADAIFSGIQQSANEFIFCGYSSSFSSNQDLVLIKTDSLFDTVWTRVLGGSLTEIGYSIIKSRNSGYYVVGSTNDSVSFDTQCYLIYFDDSVLTGLEQNADSEIEFSFYPNPTTGSVKINNPDKILKIEIYDLQGKLLKVPEFNMFGQFEAIGESGMYILNIYSITNSCTKKLLILSNE